MRLRVLDITNACALGAGAALDVWQSAREGSYSLYFEGVQDQDFLRGVQPADDDGRWPHVHLEVHPSVAQATNASN